jgi:peptidoglycan/LPS O-acetylase OafA/YrhL
MSGRATISYQPALDGVRALAVLAVLVFHADVALGDRQVFSGGYLGVSVFFTLSGYLITSLLIAEHGRTGRVALGEFYARRARRLLPASVFVVVAVSVAAALTDWFDGVTELRRHAIGSLLQVANWVFLAGEGSYQELFDRAGGAISPFEHYWSLAIEEQFYWLWPIAFLGIGALARRSRRSREDLDAARVRILGIITVLAALAAPVIAAVWGADAAYWATPARIAEILLGALLAAVLAGRTRDDRPLDRRWGVLAPLALAALTVASLTFPAAGGPAYAGALPLVAVGSTALLLGLQVDGPVRAALSWSPFVWLGRVSYGVYLYHWPLFVVLDAERTGLDGPALFAVRIGATLVLAQLSSVLLERPVRDGVRLTPRVTGAFAAGTTALAVVAAVVLVPAADSSYWRVDGDVVEAAAIRPVDEPLTPLLPEAAPTTGPSAPPTTAPPATDDTDATASTTATTTAATTTEPTASVPTSAAPTTTVPLVPSRPVRIVVAGDSTAEATGLGLVQWAAANPALAQVGMAAEPGCGFVRGGEQLVLDWIPVPARCDDWLDEELLATVTAAQPDLVMLMTTSWDVLDRRWPETGDAVLGPLDEPFATRLTVDFDTVAERLLAAGAAGVVWVRQPVPDVFWSPETQVQEDPARHAALYAAMDASAERPGVQVVDLPTWLAGTGLDLDQQARPDGVHWSPEASARIATEFLGAELIRLALTPAASTEAEDP